MLRTLGFALLFSVTAVSGARAIEKSDDAYQLVAFAAALNSASGGGGTGNSVRRLPRPSQL
jgi:hypothetical protein